MDLEGQVLCGAGGATTQPGSFSKKSCCHFNRR